MAHRPVAPIYEVVRWKIDASVSRFHLRGKEDALTLCGDPVVTIGSWFMARPPVYGQDPLRIMDEMYETKAPCRDCIESLSRGPR